MLSVQRNQVNYWTVYNELSVALYLPWDFTNQERRLCPSLCCIHHLGSWILQEQQGFNSCVDEAVKPDSEQKLLFGSSGPSMLRLKRV